MKKTRLLSLAEMRATPELATMRVLPRGNRLSITPVSEAEWNAVTRLLEAGLSAGVPLERLSRRRATMSIARYIREIGRGRDGARSLDRERRTT